MRKVSSQIIELYNLKLLWFALVWKTMCIMKTIFNLVTRLFNNAEKTAEQTNNYQVNAYKVLVNDNTASIEAVCINEYGTIYRTNDVRTIAPSRKQLNRLQRLGERFFVYED